MKAGQKVRYKKDRKENGVIKRVHPDGDTVYCYGNGGIIKRYITRKTPTGAGFMEWLARNNRND